MSNQGNDKKWKDLSGPQKALAVLSGLARLLWGVARFALFVYTLVDIRRRPAEQINGDKRLWTAVVFAGPLGQIAYLVLGRRQPEAPAEDSEVTE